MEPTKNQNRRELTKVELVVAKLQDLIQERNLQPGDRLPPEREMAALLGVNRTSLREALKLLTSLRIVRSRQGSGVYLQTSLSDVGLETLLLRQELGMQLSQEELRDILEVRRGLELFSVKLACMRLKEHHARELADVLRRAEQRIDEGLSIEEEDREFHLAVAGAGNAMLPRLLHMFYMLSIKRRERYFEDSEWARRSHEQHIGLLDAIVQRDVDLAVHRMTEHLKEAEDAWNIDVDGVD